MATAIEWTDETWNPLTGCTKVSPGCDHCYAKTMHERFNGPGSFDTVSLHLERLNQPLRWRKPRKVFVNSMSDLFHDDVPDEFIAKVLGVIGAAERHPFQLLTKRHARMRSLLSSHEFVRKVQAHWWVKWYAALGEHDYQKRQRRLMWAPGRTSMPLGSGDLPWPLPNLWLGVSVENQQWADIRIPALLDTPAAVRFLSCEPLLGPVDVSRQIRAESEREAERRFPHHSTICDAGNGGCYHPPCSCACHHNSVVRPGIDWVIVGGESGHGARPMHPDWARSLRDQCVAAGVPFLFKQWGESRPYQSGDDPTRGQLWETGLEGDSLVSMIRVGKKAAGRDLDGRTWDEYPAVAS